MAAERSSWPAISGDVTVLVPLADLGSARPLLRLASALSGNSEQGRRGKVVALGVVDIPESEQVTAGAARARFQRDLLKRLDRLALPSNVEVRTLVRVSTQVWRGIVQAAEEEGANLIMLGWKGWTGSSEAVFGTTVDDVIINAPCDIVIVKQPGLRAVRRVLVPVRGGPHAVLAARLATQIAGHWDARVTALHIEAPGSSGEQRQAGEEEFEAVLSTVDDRLLRRIEVNADDVAQGILEQARGHQLILMGAAASVPDAASLFGPITEHIARSFPGAVMIVKTRLPADLGHQEWEKLAPSVEPAPRQDLAVRVDKWFAENTFDAEEFEDLADLVRLKERQGLRISLGLPALNEEATVGQVITAIKHELVTRHPLLDEMVLIDSGSTDSTCAIAQALGIPVYQHRDLVPSVGSFRGKGEALWKSLSVLTGDIVAWIDTDIRNIHPRFVYGIVGPLLKYPRIQYVKGFYRRPIRVGGVLQSTGGGRVTELTARPLLNLFFPELSGVIQPLAGEYAGRRSLLERLPFFTGYGVEIGLLIDILEQVGLDAIGQVDLKRRVHRNQGLVSLSAMAFTILQVVMSRLEANRRVQLFDELNHTMKLIQHGPEGFHVDLRSLEDVERPPMASLQGRHNAYVEQRAGTSL